MKREINELIEKYEKRILFLKSIVSENKDQEIHNRISMVTYGEVVQDLRKLVDTSKYEAPR